MIKITELVAVVRANITSYETNMNKARDIASGLSQQFATTAKAIDNAATRISLATAAIGTGIAVQFSKYELIMKRAGAVTNTLGTHDFEQLNQAAQKMGRETVYSASQAAAAIEQMGLAGLTLDEIMTALPGALQLASSAQISITQAADVAAKTMRAFGASAEELSHINDVLVATFTRSNTDITQLGEAMKHIAPVSNALGISIEDTAAAIAKMGDAGFQGSIAGTSLRNIVSRLAGASPASIDKLRELGITTTDTSGKMLPFLDILRQIEQSAITDAQVLEIFGARGGPQLMALLEVGTDAIEKFSAELSAAGGTAQRISDANLDSLWGAWKLIESAIEGVSLAIGEKLAPAMREGAAEITKLVEGSQEQIARLATEGFEVVLAAARGFIVYLKENGAEILQTAAYFGSLLAEIIKFLAAHPELLMALLTLKITGFLGINAAVYESVKLIGMLASALWTLIPAMGASTTGAKALQLAVTGLSVMKAIPSWLMREGIPTLIAYGLRLKEVATIANLMKFGTALTSVSAWTNFITREAIPTVIAYGLRLKELILTSGLLRAGGFALAVTGIVLFANALYRHHPDIVKYNEELKKTIELTKQMSELRGKEQANALATAAGIFDPGAKRDFLEAQLEQARKDEVGAAASLSGAESAVINRGGWGEFFTGGNYITSALTQERDEAAARLAEARKFREQLEAELKTAAQEAVISSGIDGVPWGADQPAAGAMPPAGDPAAEDQERKDAETKQEEMRKQVAVKTEEMSLELAGFVQQGELTVQQAKEIWQAFKNLQREFLNGTITAQQYSYSENALNEAMRQTIQTNAQHAETITREKQARQEAIAATISDWQATATAIVKSMGPLGQFRENMNQYGQQLLDLQMKLQNGTLSLDEYEKQVQQVTNAANAAAEAEKKRRLAAGDFAGAGLNFNQSIQDRVAQFQTQRFNKMVDQAVASLYGIGPAVQNVASGFNTLQNQMGQFGQSLNSFSGQGGSRQQMAQQLMTTFATVDGQIQLLQNNIALMQQNINMLDTYRQRAAVQEEIDAMQSQLMDLIYQANAGPVLTQTPLDPYADPGLNRNATVVNNNLELPNLTRMTNADAELMAALLVDTMQRRGVLSAT